MAWPRRPASVSTNDGDNLLETHVAYVSRGLNEFKTLKFIFARFIENKNTRHF